MTQGQSSSPNERRPWYYQTWFLIAAFILGWPVYPPFVLWPAWAVLIFNATDEAITRQFPLRELTGEASLYAFRWGPEGSSEIGKLDNLLLTVAPHSAVLYYLTAAPAPPPEGLTLGGTMHIIS